MEALVDPGVHAFAMHDVADRAGVSKGLIHYHYRDKDALLVDAAARLSARIAARERAALAASEPGTALDDLQRWLETELERGEWRALLSLVHWPAAKVSAAARTALDDRRASGAETITRAFTLLGLRARIAPLQISMLFVAAMSGLSLTPADAADRRDAGDALALALLSLAE